MVFTDFDFTVKTNNKTYWFNLIFPESVHVRKIIILLHCGKYTITYIRESDHGMAADYHKSFESFEDALVVAEQFIIGTETHD